MCCAVVDDHARAQHPVSDHGTLLRRLEEALLAGVEELFRDVAADNLLFEVVLALQVARGLHVAHHASVVSGAAGLALEDVVEFPAGVDGLAVGHFGLSRDAVDTVLAPESFNVDFQVELAHPRYDGFLGFWIDFAAEGWILALEAVHSFGEGCCFLVFGLDREGDYGVRDEH